MGLRNTEHGWGWPARALHWGVAAVIVFMSGLGLYMTNAFAPGDLAAFASYQLHKSWGFVVFVLVVLRVVWRLSHRTAPELPSAMPGWERVLSQGVHVALYTLMFALPLTGWLMVSASPLQDMGVANKVFGLFEMPDPFVPGSAALSDTFKELHGAVWWGLMGTLVLHVLGALKHHYVTRDRVLSRMVRGR